MIVVALLFHKLGHYVSSWITKNQWNEWRTQLSGKRIWIEMSGVIANFMLALLLIVSITLTTKEKYLLNENAIYGTEFSDLLKNIGFENGDRIISINNQKIVLFSDISKAVILERGDANVLVLRGKEEKTIKVSESDKMDILRSHTLLHFKSIVRPDASKDTTADYLKYNERQRGIGDAFATFSNSMKMAFSYFSPYSSSMGFITLEKVTTVKGYLFLLAISSILLGFINLIPLPGLDMGNALIALAENIRQRHFNSKRLKLIRMVCSVAVVIGIVGIVFLK